MLISKRFILAVVSVFFVTAVMAQEVPRAKPECVTLNEFLHGYEYKIGFHPIMKHWAFAYVPDMDAIIMLRFNGACLSDKSGLVLKRGTSGFGPIYAHIFKGRDA